MSIKLGIVMDPVSAIKPYKDSSLAMLLAAQTRGWQLYYMEMQDISLKNSLCQFKCRELKVFDDNEHWFEYGEKLTLTASDLDVILMRKDPPFDNNYLYATHILEQAEREGVLLVNRAQGLRDINEKLFTSHFPQCCPPFLVSRHLDDMDEFLHEHQDIIIKPLDAMGGASIFRIKKGDTNRAVIFETLTNHGQDFVMLQRFIPEISAGDKRILLVDGKPVPYALARIPAKGENRGNLAAGGRGEGIALSERDYWICDQVSDTLKKMGMLFVGLDVIGDYLTEINVTSPTCIRELDAQYQLNIADDLMAVIEKKLA